MLESAEAFGCVGLIHFLDIEQLYCHIHTHCHNETNARLCAYIDVTPFEVADRSLVVVKTHDRICLLR